MQNAPDDGSLTAGDSPSCWFDEVRRVKPSVEVKLVSVTTACVSNRPTGRRPCELCQTSFHVVKRCTDGSSIRLIATETACHFSCV